MPRARKVGSGPGKPVDPPPAQPSIKRLALPQGEHPRDALENLLSDEQWGREKSRLLDRFRRLCDHALSTYQRLMDEDDGKVAQAAAHEVLALAGIQPTDPPRGGPRSLGDVEVPASVAIALVKAGAGLASMMDVDGAGFDSLSGNLQRDVTPLSTESSTDRSAASAAHPIIPAVQKEPSNGKNQSGVNPSVLGKLAKSPIEER